MDYYSNFEPPALDVAKIDITKTIEWKTLDINNKLDNINDLLDEAFIHSNVLDSNNKIKYSFTGWNVFGVNIVLESIKFIIKKRRIRRKIRGFLRATYLLVKAHNSTMRKLYHPDSSYVKNVLKKHFEETINEKNRVKKLCA